MRLSEAIRLGAMMGPQSFGDTFGQDDSSCAMGAALLAVGCPRTVTYGDIVMHFAVATAYAFHPESGIYQLVISTIRQLNDQSRWTREQIADWVATIEPQEDPHALPEADLAEVLEHV